MKTLLIFSMFCLVSDKAISQWTAQTSGTNEFLPSISFPSADTGYVISETGVLHKTVNGGTNWNTINTINADHIFFPDNNTGLAFGGTPIYKTIDGGMTWNIVLPQSSNRYVRGLYMIDQNTGFAASMNLSDSVTIYKTINGGASWSFVADDINQIYDVSYIYFLDSNTGFLGNWSGELYKTTDGGLSWNSVFFGNGMINEVAFTSPTIGYGITEMEFIKTNDGGATWTSSTPPFSAIYAAMAITPNGTIHVTGGNGFSTGTLIKSINNGSSWTQTGTSTQAFYDVCFVNDSIGYTCGTNGSIMKYNGSGSTVGIDAMNYSNESLKLFPNPVQSVLTIQNEGPLPINYIRIVNSVGEIVYSSGSFVQSIDLSGFDAGIYFIEVERADKILREKIIKN